jgi:hypothetical protein
MKITSLEILSNINIIQENLKKHVKCTNININDYITLDNETILLNVDDISIGLLNALRQIAFKFDYVYHLYTDINNIYINNTKNNTSVNFINNTEISNRISSIIIDNNNQSLLDTYVDSNIGAIIKKVNYYNESPDYAETGDIAFSVPNLIILDKHINLCLLPYIHGTFNIDNITLKKQYTNADSRYCNVNLFTVLPQNENNTIADVDYDFNKIYTKFKIKITSSGYLAANMLLPRFLNILYIKLQDTYNNDNDYILFMQSGIYLENLLVEYSYNNNINIICKNVNNDLYCYNISIKEIDKIIDLIKNDVITFTSILLNITIDNAEKNLFNKEYAQYF